MPANFPAGAGDLLGAEQHALGRAAIDHHAQARRQDRAVRQHQGGVCGEEEGVGRGGRKCRRPAISGSSFKADPKHSQLDVRQGPLADVRRAHVSQQFLYGRSQVFDADADNRPA